ncbi:MAG: hypothetical protein KGQ59_11820, partial [Bdellovibrionales bacterium]|nr:hypothetical protein [Bdellovibrionales bacterium]
SKYTYTGSPTNEGATILAITPPTLQDSYWNSDIESTAGNGMGSGVSGSSPGSAFSSWNSQIWSKPSNAFPTLTHSEIPETSVTSSLCVTSTPFDGGQGTRASPFLISNADQLQNLKCNPSAAFRLTANINLAGVNYDPPGSFTGFFDGAGYALSNLQLNRPTVSGLGLFREINGALVKDLFLQDADITGAELVGALAGISKNGSVILRCRSTGNIRGIPSSGNTTYGPQAVGGLVGVMNFAIVSESSSSAAITSAHRSAGLVGSGEPMAMIWDSYATGSVSCVKPPAPWPTTTGFCGGLAGVMAWYSSVNSSFSNNNLSDVVSYTGYTGQVTDSYVNPNSSQTTLWDPAIWDLTPGALPSHRP